MNLTLLEQTLAELRTKRAAIDAAIAPLETLLGIQPRSFVIRATVSGEGGTPGAPANAPAPPREPLGARPPRPTKPRAAKAETPAPTPKVTSGGTMHVSDDDIVAAVGRMQPVSPKALFEALRLPESAARYRFAKLIDAGRLDATGVTAQRRLSLPTPSLAAVSLDEMVLRLLRVEALKLPALLAQLPDSVAATPEEKEQLVRRSLRRLTMREQIFDVGESFKAA